MMSVASKMGCLEMSTFELLPLSLIILFPAQVCTHIYTPCHLLFSACFQIPHSISSHLNGRWLPVTGSTLRNHRSVSPGSVLAVRGTLSCAHFMVHFSKSKIPVSAVFEISKALSSCCVYKIPLSEKRLPFFRGDKLWKKILTLINEISHDL